MNNRKKSKIDIGQVLCPLLWTILLLAFLIAAAAFAWVAIPEDNTLDFWQALRKILRNIKDFEALLLAIVVTIFFQNYMNMKAEVREKDEKLKGIGHYAIEVLRDEPWPVDKDMPMVRLLSKEEDFKNPLPQDFAGFGLHFITSQKTPTYFRNVMAFEEAYFNTRKREILAHYMNTYQNVEYASPSFVGADSYHIENYEETEDAISSEFWFLMRAKQAEIRNFWISAVTEDGFLYFIFVKAKLTAEGKGKDYKLILLQQANYFVQKGELVPLA